jgi:hypothetical protein
MGTPSALRPPTRLEAWLALAGFAVCLGFHFAGALVGWQSRNLPGVEYRQAQTAISAYFINQEDNFSPAYPTPVLGKPWSIPLEFPLYQWTVVELSRASGLSLTKAGRAVSLACFYLLLPAIYLLLGRWQVAPGYRWLVLAVVVTCPLYVFYSRAFLIETMALMFSVWFWVAFERAVAQRSFGWLALAIVAGSGAGLVKVTTLLLYLLPVAGWALIRLWRNRADGRWRVELAWMAAAVAVPFALTLWWLHFSDAVKALNPAAHFLRSEAAVGFTIGAPATRFSGELWAMKGRIIAHQLTWLPLLIGGVALALLGARHRWRELGLCAGLFTAALLAFPILYAYHEYYYIANAVLLMVALGLVLVALAESPGPRWLVALAVVTVVAGQAYAYFDRYYPVQSAISPGGDGLSQSLRALTEPGEVIVVTGQDWNAMTPYYAQRRALMLRGDAEQDPAQVDAALAQLDGEKIGALAVTGSLAGRGWFIQRLVARGLEPTPLYIWHDVSVFLPAARRELNLQRLEEQEFYEVRPAPGVELPHGQPLNTWWDVANLWRSWRANFDGMTPTPVRYFSTFGLTLERGGGRMDFGAHPVTRLVFALPAGRHVLRTTVFFPPDAYRADLAEADATDGVEITLAALSTAGERRILGTRTVDPRHRAADRGRKPLRIEFTLPQAGEVELFIGPGPAGRSTRDWVMLGRLVID